ncbi:MAG: S8 family serine peptidase, partial [Candidatus Thorarchaeota archaeon]
WNMQDYYGLNLTGKDILIANLDTGIQWRHPDFFFADGGSFTWTCVGGAPWAFVNGTDGIDLNGQSGISANETLYSIDVNGNGNTDCDVDWIWLDNGTTIGSIDDGDTFFVANDTDNNNQLSAGENLIALKTPKTKYIVEKTGGTTIQCWGRNNFTSSPHYDTSGHGTGVTGILNGGQLGYRKYVGVAPDAELMAINIFGTNGLTVEEGLIWARDHGADVILIEVGSWTYEYLDGSSNVEMMIDTLTSSGIPVIVPAGNLGGSGRHIDVVGIAGAIQTVNFFVPNTITATELYLTVLTPASLANIQVNITEPTSTGTIVHQLTFGNGYYQWITTSSTSNITIQTFASTSTRNTNMLAIDISGTIKHTSSWSLSIKGTDFGTYYCYISDDDSSWSGGAQWTSGSHWFHTITWPSTADMAISVASYHTRSLTWGAPIGTTTAGGIAAFSSNGPRIDMQEKMSIAAPGGYDIISAYSSDSLWDNWFTNYGTFSLDEVFGGYRLFSGTSASGPHVAGAAALLLQLNSECGPVVKHLIEASAYTDGFTGGIPSWPGTANVGWGYGKLNVSAAVEEARKLPVIWEHHHTPSAPEYSDTVTVTANVSNADFVKLQWTNCSWSAMKEFNMTMSAGLYTATVPVHKYGFTIDYKILPVNNSAVGGPIDTDSYQIADTVAPVINTFTHNATTTVVDPTWVEVIVSVSDAVNASGIWAVDIEYTTDNWVSRNNITMVSNGTHYIGVIDPIPSPMQVVFHVVVYDNAMNTATTTDVTYDVTPATTTTTGTTTGTTDTTTTTGTTTGPTGGIPDFIQENMTYIIIGAAVLALIVLIVICRRR